VLDLNERLKDIGQRLPSLIGEDVEIVIVAKSDQALVEADPGQMDQIVVNLASNAHDAMPCGGRFILETNVVELDENSAHLRRSMKPGKYIILTISDNGTGMDFNTQCHCFEPFFTTKESGKALGLTAVFAIVRSSGGDISVCSDPGRGTTFTIYLPSVEHKSGLRPTHARRNRRPRKTART
jgi:two-component system cell cycle sensor histidine kinase/response regulator CckA